MDTLLLNLQKRLEKKNLTELSIGSFLVEYCKKKSKKPDEMSGYIKRDILFLTLSMDDDRMDRFMKREQLRGELNERLEEMWYEMRVANVRIK